MLIIKPYSYANKQDVVDLILPIQQEEFGIPITLKDQPDLLNISDFYQTNNGNFWLATLDDKVIGTIALLDIGNHQAAVRKMFVDKIYRGKPLQIGQHLLDTLLLWASEKQFNDLFLGTTEKFMAAQRFYEKNGFTEIPPSALPESFPIMSVDIKFYVYGINKPII